MTSEKLKNILYNQGRTDALGLQERSPNLTGTELCAEDDKIPSFKVACAKKNMLERTAGQINGFVCKSSAGRVVRLIQNYDSDVYTQEPEDLPAQWRFMWSQDPTKALPFISLATSPYAAGDCCTENGSTFRSKIGNNVHAPSAYPQAWEQVEV